MHGKGKVSIIEPGQQKKRDEKKRQGQKPKGTYFVWIRRRRLEIWRGSSQKKKVPNPGHTKGKGKKKSEGRTGRELKSELPPSEKLQGINRLQVIYRNRISRAGGV